MQATPAYTYSWISWQTDRQTKQEVAIYTGQHKNSSHSPLLVIITVLSISQGSAATNFTCGGERWESSDNYMLSWSVETSKIDRHLERYGTRVQWQFFKLRNVTQLFSVPPCLWSAKYSKNKVKASDQLLSCLFMWKTYILRRPASPRLRTPLLYGVTAVSGQFLRRLWSVKETIRSRVAEWVAAVGVASVGPNV